jgi:hypothetical protein
VLRNSNEAFNQLLLQVAKIEKIDFKAAQPTFSPILNLFHKEPDLIDLRTQTNALKKLIGIRRAIFLTCFNVADFSFTMLRNFNLRKRWFALTYRSSVLKSFLNYFVYPSLAAQLVVSLMPYQRRFKILYKQYKDQLKDPIYQQRINEYANFVEKVDPAISMQPSPTKIHSSAQR